ncbi:MAG: hypothetical protein L0K86_23105, partial [Actinomycetia bacterium]|nr:hypothetical protein [Actinomycetes bacterium]
MRASGTCSARLHGWIGPAAQRMQAAAEPFTAWCGTAVDDAGGIAKSLADQAMQAADLRRLLPGPNWFTTTAIDVGETVARVTSPMPGNPVVTEEFSRMADGLRESTAEAEEARRHMTVYAADSRQRESALGFWTTPPAMTVAPAEAAQHGPGAASLGAPAGGVGPGGATPSPGAGVIAPPAGQAGGIAAGGRRAPRPGNGVTGPSGAAAERGGSGIPAPTGAGTPAQNAGRPAPVPVPAPGSVPPKALQPAPIGPQVPARAPGGYRPPPRGTGVNLPLGQGGRGLGALPQPLAGPPRTGAPSSWR